MLEQGEGTVLNVYLFLDQGSKCMEGIVKDLEVESLPGDRQCPGASLSGCHRCRGCLTGSGSFVESSKHPQHVVEFGIANLEVVK